MKILPESITDLTGFRLKRRLAYSDFQKTKKTGGIRRYGLPKNLL